VRPYYSKKTAIEFEKLCKISVSIERNLFPANAEKPATKAFEKNLDTFAVPNRNLKTSYSRSWKGTSKNKTGQDSWLKNYAIPQHRGMAFHYQNFKYLINHRLMSTAATTNLYFKLKYPWFHKGLSLYERSYVKINLCYFILYKVGGLWASYFVL
jgi:hypothetical protein